MLNPLYVLIYFTQVIETANLCKSYYPYYLKERNVEILRVKNSRKFCKIVDSEKKSFLLNLKFWKKVVDFEKKNIFAKFEILKKAFFAKFQILKKAFFAKFQILKKSFLLWKKNHNFFKKFKFQKSVLVLNFSHMSKFEKKIFFCHI